MPVNESDDDASIERIVARVYDELRGLARRLMHGQASGHTLEATALVHEAYLRLAREDLRPLSRAHFVGMAAKAMRHILVDHARMRAAVKRGGGRQRVALDVEGAASDREPIVVDEALQRLARIDERKSKIVELRYFAGLSLEETAQVMCVSLATVKRDWALAKAWLHREIADRA